MQLLEIPNLAIIVGAISSLAICIVLVITQSWHGHLTQDFVEGVQKFHKTPTPRVGGIALFVGFLLVLVIVNGKLFSLLGAMVLASLPAFIFGLLEDVTKKVSVRARLFASLASGLIASFLMSTTINRVDCVFLDELLLYYPVSLAFTAVAVGALVNAINIIDGFNGLASGSVLICLAALGGIAYQSNDHELVRVVIIIAAVAAGFWLVNFPFGKIFLGDGGAYLLGFMLAWVAILLPMRNQEVSPWASLLACGYPVIELVFSVLRRVGRSYNPGHADRLHLHSLVQARISRRYFKELPESLGNASVSPFMWCYAALPASFSVLFPTSTASLLTCLLLCIAVYCIFYARLVYFGWKWPLRLWGGRHHRQIAMKRSGL